MGSRLIVALYFILYTLYTIFWRLCCIINTNTTKCWLKKTKNKTLEHFKEPFWLIDTTLVTTNPGLYYMMCNVYLPHGNDKGTCFFWLQTNKRARDSHNTQLCFNHQLQVTGIRSVFQHWLMPKSAAGENKSVRFKHG